MNPAKSVIIGLAAGVAVYAGLYALDSFDHQSLNDLTQKDPVESVAPVLSPKKLVTRSAKIGDNVSVTRMAPVLSPVLSVSPSVSPSIMVPTPVPFTTIMPTPSVSPSRTPTPAPSPIPSTLPSVTLMPTATPRDTHTGVAINEIGWMGTEKSSTDEWIELYNSTQSAVDLSGWKILIAGDNAIALSGSIAPGEYYLLERTDDTVISDVGADYIGPFGRYGLNDAGEHLTLQDASGLPIDDVDCVGGWTAGQSGKGSKASMERTTTGSWATNNMTLTIGHDAAGQAILGTPRGQNSVTP
jgi:hypothetical protein